MSFKLSVLEAMSILRPMEQNLARLHLPAYARSNSDDDEADGKVLQKWLDGLASLLVGCSPASPSNQVCAVSLSLLPSSCIVTTAFNFPSTRPEDVPNFIRSIWKWMKDASALPEENSRKNEELLELILEASSDRIRRRLKEKGKFVEPLIERVEKENHLTEVQKTFLVAAHLLHLDMFQRLGPDVKKPDFGTASQAFRFRVQKYEAAKSKLQDFYWLYPFETKMVESGAKAPSLVRYLEKLQKPYSQYILIRKVARKSFIRDALSIPLHVDVLPSPNPAPASAFQSVVNFEARVRSYLRDALFSFSPDATSSELVGKTIDFFWQRIQAALDEQDYSPPLLAPHCECILLSHHLDLHLDDIASSTRPARTPYHYFGVSKLSCFECALYFQAYKACELGPSFQTCGSHTEVLPCALPASRRGHDKADEAIKSEMGVQLENIIGSLLAAKIERQRKMSQSSVDSTGSSPPSEEGYVDVLKATMYPRLHQSPP
ncbi:hypothetical protein K438DRAFT_1968280 [Mycena galopus ATCC 62051]|nr:hypothetical protein K438DRAFT_1968280 [Mycena galopus ATCC 62051]